MLVVADVLEESEEDVFLLPFVDPWPLFCVFDPPAEPEPPSVIPGLFPDAAPAVMEPLYELSPEPETSLVDDDRPGLLLVPDDEDVAPEDPGYAVDDEPGL